MTDKEKGKAHPFAGHLNPKEEVLWMWASSEGSKFRQQVLIMGAMLLGVLGLLLVGVVPGKTPLAEKFSIVVGVGSIAGVAILVVFGIMWIFKWISRRITRGDLPEHAYAVTNQRLLYRHNKNVVTIPLEKLPSISLFLGDGDKGTFSFGAFFPMWPDIEEAVRIKHLIDDAQNKRMQRL